MSAGNPNNPILWTKQYPEGWTTVRCSCPRCVLRTDSTATSNAHIPEYSWEAAITSVAPLMLPRFSIERPGLNLKPVTIPKPPPPPGGGNPTVRVWFLPSITPKTLVSKTVRDEVTFSHSLSVASFDMDYVSSLAAVQSTPTEPSRIAVANQNPIDTQLTVTPSAFTLQRRAQDPEAYLRLWLCLKSTISGDIFSASGEWGIVSGSFFSGDLSIIPRYPSFGNNYNIGQVSPIVSNAVLAHPDESNDQLTGYTIWVMPNQMRVTMPTVIEQSPATSFFISDVPIHDSATVVSDGVDRQDRGVRYFKSSAWSDGGIVRIAYDLAHIKELFTMIPIGISYNARLGSFGSQPVSISLPFSGGSPNPNVNKVSTGITLDLNFSNPLTNYTGSQETVRVFDGQKPEEQNFENLPHIFYNSTTQAGVFV